MKSALIKTYIYYLLAKHKNRHTADGHFFGGFNDDTLVNAITGKPFVGNGADDAGDFGDTFEFPAPDGSMDFGVFHESEADINPNSVLKATCGNLSQKLVQLMSFPSERSYHFLYALCIYDSSDSSLIA